MFVVSAGAGLGRLCYRAWSMRVDQAAPYSQVIERTDWYWLKRVSQLYQLSFRWDRNGRTDMSSSASPKAGKHDLKKKCERGTASHEQFALTDSFLL